MNVTINPYYGTVEIANTSFMGTALNVTLTLAEAIELSASLNAKAEALQAFAMNYHDCRDCGQFHHNSFTVCPNRYTEEA